MFNLYENDEIKDFLREIRKTLKNKGYNKTISKCNRYIGTIHLNYVYEYYTKKGCNIVFEIERDLEENSVNAKMYIYDKFGDKTFKNIMLADIKGLC